jgi:hypothetical protein
VQRKRRKPSLLVVAIALLPLAAGCGRSTTVTGNVSYEGKPVSHGAITFLPADGRGATFGGPITDGQYRVEGLTPGEKIVQIVGVKKIRFALSGEEMARAANEAAKRADTSGIVDRADQIPPNADGNNAKHDLQPGKQTLDLTLCPPAAR